MTTPTMDPLSALLAGSVDLLDIPPSVCEAAVARYEDVGDFLADTGGSRCGIYPQGSFLIGTPIRPPADTEYEHRLGVTRMTSTRSRSPKRNSRNVSEACLRRTAPSSLVPMTDPDDFFEKRCCWTLSILR